MREVLFRGKKTSNNEWVYGGIVHQTDFYGEKCDSYFIIDGTTTWDNNIGEEFEVYSETLGQFTGLCDKNGKRIFEGDIVEAKLTNGNYQGFSWGLQIVSFKKGAFGLMNAKKELTPFESYNPNVGFEVVGNIYDNNELLKDGGQNV